MQCNPKLTILHPKFSTSLEKIDVICDLIAPDHWFTTEKNYQIDSYAFQWGASPLYSTSSSPTSFQFVILLKLIPSFWETISKTCQKTDFGSVSPPFFEVQSFLLFIVLLTFYHLYYNWGKWNFPRILSLSSNPFQNSRSWRFLLFSRVVVYYSEVYVFSHIYFPSQEQRLYNCK